MRQSRLPLHQVLDGHDFAAEQYLPHAGRYTVTEAVHDGDKAHGTDSPDKYGDLVVCQIVHEFCGLTEISARDDLHLSPRVQCRVQVFDRNVKVKGCLIAQNIVLCDAENFGKLRDKIQHRAVADGDAFWHTGASACEVDVQRINVHSLTAAVCQQCSVRRRGQQVVKPENLPAVPQRGGCGSVGLVRNKKCRGQSIQYLQSAGSGLAGVKHRVAAARVDCAKHGSKGGDGFFQVKCHRAARHRAGRQKAAGAAGRVGQLCPGTVCLVIPHSRGIRAAGVRGFKPVQNVCLHRKLFS